MIVVIIIIIFFIINIISVVILIIVIINYTMNICGVKTDAAVRNASNTGTYAIVMQVSLTTVQVELFLRQVRRAGTSLRMFRIKPSLFASEEIVRARTCFICERERGIERSMCTSVTAVDCGRINWSG